MNASASTTGPLSLRAATSTGGKLRRISRKRRVSLASAIETRKRAEASHGAHLTRNRRIRSSPERPLVVPMSSKGTALESNPTVVTRSGILAAQTAAYGPPHDQPMTANRSMSSASANAATSGGPGGGGPPGGDD